MSLATLRRWEIYHCMEPQRVLGIVPGETGDEAITRHLTDKHGPGDHGGLASNLRASRRPVEGSVSVVADAIGEVLASLPEAGSMTVRLRRLPGGMVRVEVLSRDAP